MCNLVCVNKINCLLYCHLLKEGTSAFMHNRLNRFLSSSFLWAADCYTGSRQSKTFAWSQNCHLSSSWKFWSGPTCEAEATGSGPTGSTQGLQTLVSCFHSSCSVLLCTAICCHDSSSRPGTLAPLLWFWFLCSGHTREGQDTQRIVSLCASKLSLSLLCCWFIYTTELWEQACQWWWTLL